MSHIGIVSILSFRKSSKTLRHCLWFGGGQGADGCLAFSLEIYSFATVLGICYIYNHLTTVRTYSGCHELIMPADAGIELTRDSCKKLGDFRVIMGLLIIVESSVSLHPGAIHLRRARESAGVYI